MTLTPQNADWPVGELSSLALAFIGDAIWEVYVRNHTLAMGIRKPHELHKASTKYVRAGAQAHIVQVMFDGLSEEEQAVLKRGRNAKSGSVRKNADVIDYRHSTGFEALIGFLYGTKQLNRLDELCKRAIQIIDEMKG